MSDQQEKQNSLQPKKYPNQGLLGNVRKLYLNTKSTDISFLFGSIDGFVSSIAAHKCVLAASSDVFEAMFYGELKETADIRITDSSDAAFIEFMQFFYLNEVQLTEENIADVLYLGHKYNVTDCIDVCVQFLKDTITAENTSIGLDLAIHYDQRELLKFFEQFIIVHTADVFKSADFLEYSNSTLAHILQMDILSCSEVDVFKACMAWVKAKSGGEILTKALVDTHLGETYYKIRFASMTMEELVKLSIEHGSVLSNDFEAISKVIVLPKFQSEIFNTSPREIKSKTDDLIMCAFKNGNEWRYKSTRKETTIFSTTEPLMFSSFTCGKIQFEGKTICNLSADLLVDVEIFEIHNFHDANARNLLKMTASLKSTDTKIVLAHPILVRPEFFYKIVIGPFPDGHIYFSELLKTEIQLRSNIIVKLHKCNSAIDPTDDSRHGKEIGLICSLDFFNLF